MPIFVDRHELPAGTTALEVARAHVEDLALQDRFGVEFLAYWFDAGRGTLFCLVRAPDREAVNRVHREAHGGAANAVIEVELSAVEAFLGRIADPPPGPACMTDPARPRRPTTAAFDPPPSFLDARGATRRVGVEVEFTGLGARAAARALAAGLGGAAVEEEDPHASRVRGAPLGNLAVGLDLRHAHPRARGHAARPARAARAARALSTGRAREADLGRPERRGRSPRRNTRTTVRAGFPAGGWRGRLPGSSCP